MPYVLNGARKLCNKISSNIGALNHVITKKISLQEITLIVKTASFWYLLKDHLKNSILERSCLVTTELTIVSYYARSDDMTFKNVLYFHQCYIEVPKKKTTWQIIHIYVSVSTIVPAVINIFN